MSQKIVGLMLLGLASIAYANCYSINNPDSKNYCLAQTKQQPSYCYSIYEQDTKNDCLAQIKKQRSYCYSIRNQDLKNRCLALVQSN